MKLSISNFFLCLILIVLIPGTAFSQIFSLSLVQEDIRLEWAFLDGDTGYSLFVRKKQNIESVILTEPAGFHALRSMQWNTINGNEIRTLSNRVLSDDYSRFSIVSSTPIPDRQFGMAFQLFIPSRVVYGNPSSFTGTVFIYIHNGFQFNIRTFDSKFADPNTGRFQNNLFYMASNTYDYPHYTYPQSIQPFDPSPDLGPLKKELRGVVSNPYYMEQMNDKYLKDFLSRVFLEEQSNELQRNRRGARR
ncbi:MAG: hypothetical protein LBH43_02675 [Treponema sp.]|jgi:hypothetical protein|nr:hypothetical protein [Treponema sp.]